jgi:hypothetical protein
MTADDSWEYVALLQHTSLKAATLDRTPAAALCTATNVERRSVFRP